jgi:hypothetical protein
VINWSPVTITSPALLSCRRKMLAGRSWAAWVKFQCVCLHCSIRQAIDWFFFPIRSDKGVNPLTPSSEWSEILLTHDASVNNKHSIRLSCPRITTS